MTEAERYEHTIAGLFRHIMMLRKELKWIGDSTHDPNTKLQVRATLDRSLRARQEEKS